MCKENTLLVLLLWLHIPGILEANFVFILSFALMAGVSLNCDFGVNGFYPWCALKGTMQFELFCLKHLLLFMFIVVCTSLVVVLTYLLPRDYSLVEAHNNSCDACRRSTPVLPQSCLLEVSLLVLFLFIWGPYLMIVMLRAHSSQFLGARWDAGN